MPLHAGGGPENLLLVVNPESPDSLAIANAYAALRRIPPSNILFVPWPEEELITGVDAFRERILSPILQGVHDLRLTGQVDYIVYSSGYPYRVNIGPDVTRLLKAEEDRLRADGKNRTPEWPEVLTKAGSLNGLTYFSHLVRNRDAAYAGLTVNRYYRHPNWSLQEDATLGFRATFQFDEIGNRVAENGASYFLSTLLGFTQGRGNTREEVLDYLKRAAEADGTRPEGTIYYARNGDVRSRTRHDLFPDAVAKLRELNVRAEIIEGKIPQGKADVQGLMAGVSSFNWAAGGSTILPGAICEHLTSWGGGMDPKCPQTPITEFLRRGAAGSGGAVLEPYAIPAKFPDAMLHVHYAKGCTLAEAFYQSVAGPYQLLILGDPLCRPWADIPAVEVEGLAEGAAVQGVLKVTATAAFGGDTRADGFEMFVDGRRVAVAGADGALEFDTTGLPDGQHELRVVAFEPEPIRTQGRRIIPFRTANHGREMTVAVKPPETVTESETITVEASCTGATRIGVFHGTRPVAQITGETGKADIPAKTLGAGPVRLDFVAFGAEGPTSNVIGEPVFLQVKSPTDNEPIAKDEPRIETQEGRSD